MAAVKKTTIHQTFHKAMHIRKKYKAWRTSAKYLVFLMSLETLTWTSAFYGNDVSLSEKIDWTDLLVITTLITGLFAANPKKHVKIISICFAVLTVAVVWVGEVMGGQGLKISSDVCLAVFFGYVASMIFYDIWTTRGVTFDTIIGSLCVYVLIGATWAFFYSLTELFVPNSFQLTIMTDSANAENLIHSRNYPLLMYYSFVTLCSLGFGDMLPISPAARMLSTGEAIVGQFYLAIFVARLIALYIPQNQKKAEASPDL
jgi:voltage-gated potassium channel